MLEEPVRYDARHVVPVGAAPLVRASVLVAGGRIAEVGPSEALAARHPSIPLVDLGEAAIVPGAVNAHTWLEPIEPGEVRPRRGEDLTVWAAELLRRRAAAEPGLLERAARLGVAAAAEAATAALGEVAMVGASVAPLAEADRPALVCLELVRDDPGVADAVLEAALRRLAAWRSQYAGTPLRFGLSCNSPQSCSADLLRAASSWCAADGLALVVHAVEGQPPAPEPRARSPIGRLAACGVLHTGALIVHGAPVDERDLALLAATATSVIHCPRSDAMQSSERMPYAAYRAAGIRIALGTKGADSVSVWDEARAAWATHRAAGEPIDPLDLLGHATRDGAAALGLAEEAGEIAVGRRADLAVVRFNGLPEPDRASPVSALTALWEGKATIEPLPAGSRALAAAA